MISYLEKHRIISLILTFLIALEIFHFSTIPGTADIGVTGGNWIPRAYHFIVFFLLSFFILATIKKDKKIKASNILVTTLVSIIYAISDEIHQFFVPFRFPSFSDVLTDSLGIFSSLIIYNFINRKINQKKNF